MSDYESKAERTARQIIETAAPVFNKKGYAGASLSDITEATGLTKGAIYGNFKNKDELALKCFAHNLSRIAGHVQREMQGQQSNLAKLLSFPRAYQQAFADLMAMGGCPIVNAAVDADDTHQPLHRLALEAIERWRGALMLLVEQGQAAGEIKAEADAQKIAEIIISLVEGGSAMSKATGQRSFMAHALEQVESMIESIRG